MKLKRKDLEKTNNFDNTNIWLDNSSYYAQSRSIIVIDLLIQGSRFHLRHIHV
jgi:hypothetical protein